MQIRIVPIRIQGRTFQANLLFIEESDRTTIRSLFRAWKKLSSGMRNFKSRGINIPEGISESAFALEMRCPRVISVGGVRCSFDNFDLNHNRRLQIKAVSVDNDLTSFGPKSVWDDLYWLDFYRNGVLDGSFDVYKIPNNLVYRFKVNARQTFRDQQNQGKRPRIRIRKCIINPNNLNPIKTCRI
jgi:hypothetical protein